MSAYRGPQHKGAAAARHATKRAQAEARNAATAPERRARARRECPHGKRQYPDAHTAQVELVDRVLQRNRGKAKRQEQRAYQCPDCGGWHLTSKPDRASGGAG